MRARAVVVAHRETMVAEGLAAALARYPWLVPVAVGTSAPDAEARAAQADVVVLDPCLPGAAETGRRLRRRGVRVVFLGDPPEPEEDEGAHVPTTRPIAHLAAALVPEMPPGRPRVRLTARQREILSLTARGLAAKEVARHLGISPKTVEHHKTRIFQKLGVANQTAAVSVAFTAPRSVGWS